MTGCDAATEPPVTKPLFRKRGSRRKDLRQTSGRSGFGPSFGARARAPFQGIQGKRASCVANEGETGHRARATREKGVVTSESVRGCFSFRQHQRARAPFGQFWFGKAGCTTTVNRSRVRSIPRPFDAARNGTETHEGMASKQASLARTPFGCAACFVRSLDRSLSLAYNLRLCNRISSEGFPVSPRQDSREAAHFLLPLPSFSKS